MNERVEYRVCFVSLYKSEGCSLRIVDWVVSTKDKLTKHDRLWVFSAPHIELGAVARSAGVTYCSYSAV